MARLRRYRKRKYHWSASINELNNTPVTASPGVFATTALIVATQTQELTRATNLYHIKNVEIIADIHSDTYGASNVIQQVCCYMMFVPQGMTVTPDYNKYHPEYIMAMKYLGMPNLTQNQNQNDFPTQITPTKIKTRLQRKLNTGDSIVLLIKGINTSNVETTIYLNGVVRYWTRSN